MDTIILDLETYYAADYSIKKLGVMQYVRDARFHIHGVGIKVNDGPTEWHTNLDILQSFDWRQVCLVGHNLYFDATILFERFGITPAKFVDTMSLARALLPRDTSVGLNNVASLLGLGHKIEGTLESTKGLVELSPEQLDRLGQYCIRDVDLTYAVYQRLVAEFPTKELELVSLTTRMAVRPLLHIDEATARKALAEAEINRQDALRASPVPKTILSSNKQFAAYLTSIGLDVPTKISKTTQKETWALGQNDPEFIELMEAHPEHQALWNAREAMKSTIGTSRAARWIQAATTGSRRFPMPLNYYGAHTGRWSGTDGINVQNLPRGGLLRKAITAPEGHVILVADSSQIELRVSAWFCDHHEVLDTLRAGRCVYRLMAMSLYNVRYDDVTKEQRQFSKAVVLGCGYGMGWRKFQHFCKTGPFGMPPIHLSDADAQHVINTYRTANAPIKDMWYQLDAEIPTLLAKTGKRMKCIQFLREYVQFPNGLGLDYAGLHQTERGWFFGDPAKRPLWGGTLLENIIQGLARIVVADQMLAIDALPDVEVVGMTHDEVIAVCPVELAEERFAQCIEIMSTPPDWAPDLPLGAEGGFDVMYSK